ncbi:MAG: DUF3052 domain-containing protein [Gammaproteobacteria bacterium]|nr:DUF3052 domain-containing protein [Gammaproteobacteria bacterium]NNF62134.1 DUF3052 family protein [Gammaproteobacteria bacterium]
MAGYSGTPLQKKLGLKPGMRAVFIREPDNYRTTLGELPAGLRLLSRPGKEMEFVHLFCASIKDLRARLSGVKRALARDGTLWVSWPKKSSGMQSDLAEGDVRSAGLKLGLVDVKICAVDDTWSALKFVYRVKDR